MMARVLMVLTLMWQVSTILGQTSSNRLPTSITPISYALRLEPDMDDNTISGTVMITFNTTSNQSIPVTSVNLHLGLDVTLDEDSVTLLELSGEKRTIGAIEYDDPNTLIKVVLPEGDLLQYNQVYIISLQFTSLLYSEANGLFTGTITSTSKYIASNFRPTFARTAFPCFDEPQFRSPVTLQVLRPASYSVVSTAPLDHSSEIKASGKVLDTFKPTPPIPIHSLGLFISELSPVESSMGVSLYLPTGMPASVPFLHSLLDSIRTTVGAFPLPLKLVVLPDQLKMHLASYGFVFISTDIYDYNEQEPLYAAHVWETLRMQLAEAFFRQFLEFSKTPSWWSHLWLSEGVGAFLASYIQPEVVPRLKVETRSEVLGVDFDYPTKPVVNSQIGSHWDIEKLVRGQSLRNKGLGVLNMWNDNLPEGVVVKTITDYIHLPDSVVTTDNFLAVLVRNIWANRTYDVTPAVASLPVWLNTTGYPTVTYLPLSDLSFQLTQRSGNSSANSLFWPVSISFAQNYSRDWSHYRWGLWLLNGSSTFSPRTFKGNQWVILNLESGLYRVDYGQSWETIQVALKEDLVQSTTPDSVKAAIQDDAVALCLQGNLTFSTAFAVLASTQRNMLDWFPVAKAFDAFANKIGNDKDIYDEFSMFAASLFSADMLADLDLQNRSAEPRMQYIRALMTPWLCEFEIGNFRQVVATLFDQLLQGDINKIDPGDLENVACYGAKYNGSVVNSLLTAYGSASSPRLRSVYTTALGCLSDTLSVQRVLNLLVDSTNPIATSDAKRIIVSLASKLENSATVINFVSQQPATIQSVLGSGCLGDVLLTLGKLRIDMSKVQYLGDDQSVDPYVVQSALRAISRTNNSWTWWTEMAAELDAALPQKHKTTTTRTTETTSEIPSTTEITSPTASELTTSPTSEAPTTVTTLTTPAPTAASTATTGGSTPATTSGTTPATTGGSTPATTSGTTPATTGGTTAATTSGTTATLPPTQDTTPGSRGTTAAPSSSPESIFNMKVFSLIVSSVIIALCNSYFVM